MMKYILFISTALLLMGCSSFYYHPDQKTLKQANIFMQNGKVLEQETQYLNALNTYMEAYRKFTLIDKLDGKAYAMLSLAREYYRLGDMNNYNLWRDSVSTLIELKLPYMKDQIDLLDLEIQFKNRNYEKVIELSQEYKSKNFRTGTEICSYRLIAKSKMNQGTGSEKFYLRSSTGKLAKLYKKHKLEEPSILAFAYYSMGYMYTTQALYRKALQYFQKAYAIDQSEEHYTDIADDVYMMGFIYEKQMLYDLARNSYARALDIGKQTQDEEIIQRVTERLNNLPE